MGVQSTCASKSSSWLIFLFSLYFVVLNQCCTQYLAYIFHYSSFLGSHFFGFYLPFSWFFWIFKFYDYAPHQCNLTFVLFCIGTLIGLASFSIWAGFGSRSNKSTDDLHGTAHFATFDEVQETGLLPRKKQKGQGVYCGAFKDHKTGVLHYLRHDGPKHIIVLAPTRSGKGVGLVVPTLLSWPHSLFVLDTKGENYAMTAGWRKQYAGNKILRFDQAEPDIGCSWNPLGEIRFRTRHQVADTQNITLMVIDDGKGIAGDHFRSAAFELLNGLILHALYKSKEIGRLPCLQDCAHMLTGVGEFSTVLQDSDNFDYDGDPKTLSSLFREMEYLEIKSENPLFKQADQEARLVINGVGRRMAGTPARELGSIISTANNALSL
ncbi:type IV secretory system conjugative DNA transfer family protein [Bartonella sp. Raccoon60]|uniref:type IV secretory system conjugative DNA transfer family protein n=1 Tax=Bartonella sp. Raccoon60 TaxID=1933912 RepID=UPI0009C3B46F|nr:type IV secretory system conjugative DNA transfer family protein [Bartonella sp. Raccoon60]AQX26180.1 type IV secretion system protein VirD4 [Bartonella sp. Raccoon60]